VRGNVKYIIKVNQIEKERTNEQKKKRKRENKKTDSNIIYESKQASIGDSE